MHFRAVANRCAVDIRQLQLPVSDELAIQILCGAGFSPLEVDVVRLGRELIGAEYRRGAPLAEAPKVFDCSGFVKYLYGRRGIWLPRRSIQQRDFGNPVRLEELEGGDLVFCSGRIDYFYKDPNDGIGHVGMATGKGTVIHAANSQAGVIEVETQVFLRKREDFRGARRIIPANMQVVTMQTPVGREVEISDDMRWIVLQRLP